MIVNSASHIPDISDLVFTCHMKTVSEIRRENIEILVSQTVSKTIRELSELSDVSAAYLSQVRNSLPDSKTGKAKELGDKAAEKLEIAMGKPRGWMDHPHDEQPFNKNDHPPTLVERLMAALAPVLSQDQRLQSMAEENRRMAAKLRSAKEDIAAVKEEIKALKLQKRVPQ